MEARLLGALGNLKIAPNSPSESVRPPARAPVSVERRLDLVKSEADQAVAKKEAEAKPAKEPTKEEIQDATQVLNGVMSDLHTNVKFAIHEKTGVMMVQIVDARDQRVIKEIPSKDFLDTMAKLRDLAGAIFDHHA